MEWVWVSALVGSVLVWAFVKVLEIALAWKLVEAMEKHQGSQIDSELAQMIEKWTE
jgi:hypothetical protein